MWLVHPADPGRRQGKSEDLLWFTIYHEAGHIVLHGKRDVFLESGGKPSNTKEKEADEFARDFLIPMKDWQAFTRKPTCCHEDQILRFATRLGITPSIVVGRLQHEKHLSYKSRLNKLKRRFEFA